MQTNGQWYVLQACVLGIIITGLTAIADLLLEWTFVVSLTSSISLVCISLCIVLGLKHRARIQRPKEYFLPDLKE